MEKLKASNPKAKKANKKAKKAERADKVEIKLKKMKVFLFSIATKLKLLTFFNTRILISGIQRKKKATVTKIDHLNNNMISPETLISIQVKVQNKTIHLLFMRQMIVK